MLWFLIPVLCRVDPRVLGVATSAPLPPSLQSNSNCNSNSNSIHNNINININIDSNSNSISISISIVIGERGSAPKRVGTLRFVCPPSASVQWQPDGLTIHTKKWLLGAGFLGAPPISLTPGPFPPVLAPRPPSNSLLSSARKIPPRRISMGELLAREPGRRPVGPVPASIVARAAAPCQRHPSLAPPSHLFRSQWRP